VSNTVHAIISFIPGLGNMDTILSSKIACETNEALSILAHNGVTCLDSVHMNVVVDDRLNVYIVGSTANFAFSTK